MPQKPPTSVPVLLRIARPDLSLTERALSREWLEVDGLGGFACSTILLCNLRRYHGLLVAPFGSAGKRFMFLTHLEETLRPVGGNAVEVGLSMARYRGTFQPLGHRHLESFELRPWPSFTYMIGALGVRREILMLRGTRAVLVRWSLFGQGPELDLRVRPMLACREADALTFENSVLDATVRREGEALLLQPYAQLPAVALNTQGAPSHFEEHPTWVHGLEYSMDLERGYDGHEDNFSHGWISMRMRPGMEVVLAASLDAPVNAPLELFRRTAAERSARLAMHLHQPGEARAVRRATQLHLAADDFLYDAQALVDGKPRVRRGVLAGYPWFLEWGRDTFLSLPGLYLSRGQVAECGEALVGATSFLQGGLMPNIFAPRPEDSAYNSADAALWFARACLLFDRAGGERGLIDEHLLPALRQIAESYLAGTELGLECTDKGLLRAGSKEHNATWMDAVTPMGPVTPRNGCAVELNALWYSLLAYLEELEQRAGRAEQARAWRKRKRLTGANFLRSFWVEEGRYLADVVQVPTASEPSGSRDDSVRPNMILAAALEFSPLSDTRRKDIVRRVEFELVTSRGLRTLSPRHPSYRGVYAGDPQQRDQAYHQGTVWPWLLGSFVEASVRAFGPAGPGKRALVRLLEGFDEHLDSHGLGHVSEVFDGDPPHRPGGCFAQAWNTAELLRAWSILTPAARGKRA